MNQPSLFDHGPTSRNETYRQILPEIPQRQKQWLRLIVDAGFHGVTLDELSAMSGQSQNAFSGRITELAKAGRVTRTKERRPTRAGSTAAVIVAREYLIDETAMPAAD